MCSCHKAQTVGYQGVGDEELLPNCTQVIRRYGTSPANPIHGLYLDFSDGGQIILQAGTVYVMNDRGATVATWDLNVSSEPR